MNKRFTKVLNRRTKLELYRFKLGVLLRVKYMKRKMMGLYFNENANQLPSILQLPITYKCNFDCVMCGMKELASKPGFSVEIFRKILKDPLFIEIKSVGINGGEPFILTNLTEYVQAILDMMIKIEDIYIITNGYFTDRILNDSEWIKELCLKRNVRFHLTVSIDGIGDVQDKIRGKNGAFKHVFDTCRRIIADEKRYCDTFGAICTISKINIYSLPEIEVWSKSQRINIDYNIATLHKRLCNESRYKDFSVFTDKHAQMMAAEFFYSKFIETREERYFALYYAVHTGNRVGSCDHQHKAVTLTPDGQLSYCATFSDEIGEVVDTGAKGVFFAPSNLKYRENMHCKHCSKCTHYLVSMTQKHYNDLYSKELMRISKVY